jgi:hypothetical protein
MVRNFALGSVIVSPLRRMWRRLLNDLAQDVPEAIAVCEFDCRKEQCTGNEWAKCERRLKEASGELMALRQLRLFAATSGRDARPNTGAGMRSGARSTS